MCTWNRNHPDIFGYLKKNQDCPTSSIDIKPREEVTEKTPVERLLEFLNHLHV